MDIFAASPAEEKAPRADVAARRRRPAAELHVRGRRGSRADRARCSSARWARWRRRSIARARALRAGHDGARRRGGAHAQDRPLLPGGHRGRVRRLARAAGQGRGRPRRSSGAARWRTTAGARSSRARTSTARYLLDGEGNPINKRNAWQARSAALRAADSAGRGGRARTTACGSRRTRAGPITLTAKLNYRKFARYYTQFAYAGEPGAGTVVAREPRQPRIHLPAGQHPEERVRQDQGRIPDLPIVTLAEPRPCCRSASGRPTPWQPVVRKQDRERWNDWGIGLLLQGDLKGAEYAFTKVTEAEPGLRRRLAERGARAHPGRRDRGARSRIIAARARDRSRARPHPLLQGAWSRRPTATTTPRSPRCAAVDAKYPRDRVVLNQIGPHPLPEAAVRRSGRGARAGAAASIRRTCRRTTT